MKRVCHVCIVFFVLLGCVGLLSGCGPSMGGSPQGPSRPESGAAEAKDPPAPPPAPGTVEGRVIYAADPNRPWHHALTYVRDSGTGHLAGAVVCLEGPGLARSAADASRTAIIDQLDMQFVPRTSALRAGDTVLFKNSDPRVHNVRSSSDLLPINIALSPGGELRRTLPRAGGISRVIELGCEFHPEMEAWIFAFEHRHFAVSDRDGRFRLEGVPPGEYRLRMNHPAGELSWTRGIAIGEGEVLTVDIDLSPDDRGAPRD